MCPNVFQIAEILVAHAVQAHRGDIAIIAYYGSYAKGTASPTSDLDLFYIPTEAGRAGSLCCQFIIDGLPYDFWPVSWEFAESIANARSGRPWAVSASLIADAQVLYHRSPEELDRFLALQARIAELTQPACRAEMVERALDAFKDTLFQLGQMRCAAPDDVAGVLWAGQQFVNSAINCLALVNQTYFSKGWGANWPEVLRLAHRPDRLEELVEAILLSPDVDGILAAADRLAGDVRGILRTAQAALAEPGRPPDVFADFYFFVFEYRGKVLAACEREDVMVARCAAFQLQQEICQLMNKVDPGFYGTDWNLLGEYNGGYAQAGFPDLTEPAVQGDLVELARRVRRLDEGVRAWFERHSIALNILASEADLRRFLTQRDHG
ncbi:MAG: nucleotidyltransferase domain-containing protein [Chloroflexi bacterium]|nr:nucleotidyltransferase domain-containing protein [Chloroflexota bacterium]